MQLSFGDAEDLGGCKRTRREVVLAEREQVVPWQALRALIEPHYPKFDAGNRLRSAAGQGSRYDAWGRRVRSDAGGAQRRYSLYAQDGRLLWQRDEVAGTRINNAYFAGSLLAEVTRPLASDTVTLTYFHTDALGSPIARSSSAGSVIETSEYEPYGLLLNRSNDDRAGYTGHVMDSASGLTYMQQRYYDPQIGRFLSVDPVAAYSKKGILFNRYWYANNNPYKFTDPDGRYVCTTGKGGSPCSVEQAAQVEQGMADLQTAAQAFKPGSVERAIVDRIIGFYGKAGEKNGVTVRVDSSIKNSGSAVTRWGKTTVTVNPAQSIAAGNGNAAVARADFAGTLMHEGNHGVDQRRFGMPRDATTENWGEKRSALAEALLFQGLGQDSPWGSWTRGGGGINPDAIEREADASTARWIECKKGGCE